MHRRGSVPRKTFAHIALKATRRFWFLVTVAIDPLAHLNPGKFLSTPGLWIGLALAAIFPAAAVRLRRYREPI
jgi:hypothetical protein